MSHDAKTTMAMWFAAMAMIACALAWIGCKQSAAPAPLPLAVIVTEVVEKDVPIYAEWVGTTVGFVNAQVTPRVQGYLLRQDYKDGAFVKTGDLLFEIDDRAYTAALDQALGDLAQQRANFTRNQVDVARYTPLAARGAPRTPDSTSGGRRSTRRSTASRGSHRSRSAISSPRRPWSRSSRRSTR